MFDRFTDRARTVMELAAAEARRQQADSIDTEHILLALVQEGSGVAANVLHHLHVDLKRIHAALDAFVKPRPPAQEGVLPFTLRARKVLELAVEEAEALGHDHVGTEHLLLGLMAVKQGTAAKVLHGLGLRPEQVREEVLAFLQAGQEWQRGEEGAEEREHGFDPVPGGGREVLSLAKAEARRLNQGFLGTEHLLVGLAQSGGVAGRILRDRGLALERIRTEVEKLVKSGPTTLVQGNLPFTPRAKRALELALEEARVPGHGHLGTDPLDPEHLLLGLLRVEDGTAARVLVALGARFEELRAEVIATLQKPGRDRSPTFAAPMPQREPLFLSTPGGKAVFQPERMGKATLWQGDALFVGLNAFEPGQQHGLHSHAGTDKLYLLLQGRGRFEVGDAVHEVGAGGLVVAPAGVPHGVVQVGEERLVVLVVMAPPPPPKA